MGKRARFPRESIPDIEPICIECGSLAVLRTGAEVYPNRPDLADRRVYVCACGARVGVHKGTIKPLGLPCGAETALARDHAHRVFDPIWRRKAETTDGSRGSARQAAYRWLAGQLGVAAENCHIAHFDAATCRRVIEICKPIADRVRKSQLIESQRRYAADCPDTR